MKSFKKWFPIIVGMLLPIISISQRITYSEPERDDSKGMSFEIIGKVSGNFLVYKTIRNIHVICAYDNDMKLSEKSSLGFMPDKVLNVDFIAYPDFFYMIYQYQRKSILRCMAVKFDAKGHQVGEQMQLDTTFIGFFADNKIYNTINSEDKQKIMVYKIQKKYEKYTYTTVLFDSKLQLLRKSRMTMNYDDRRNIMSDFFVDNDGNFLFGLGSKNSNREYINKVTLAIKPVNEDNFEFHDLDIGKGYLDELKLKVDNYNKKYLINSFFYTSKRGDIEGLYTGVWDRATNSQTLVSQQKFSDTLKRDAKTDGSYRMAFNNFFIKDVVLKRDGGFLLMGEDYYTQSRSNPWNRMDYIYGMPMTSYDYYYPGYYNPYRYRGMYNNQTRYYFDNIAVLSVSNTGQIEWSRVIHKSQYDDETDKYLSFNLFNAGGYLHFLFNELERKNKILSDQTVEPDGNITRNPTLKSLDKGYEFMPMYAKQVGAKQIIIPCDYRNYICFAKIDY